MNDSKRTLIVVLSMHRSGSSLTTGMLHRMGMSLGPFELLEAAASNPRGHFEAVPFYNLNRRVQECALGFPDDLPDSPEVLSRLCETQGEWSMDTQAAGPLVEEGRSLIRTLVDSGEVSGFKDPRTVLTWPFWERVLAGFPGLRIMPVSLLRSPHEVAMSLVSRRNGWCGYWSSLDIVAVHLRRQKAIIEGSPQPPQSLCFGSPSFLGRLENLARLCGLTWNAAAALEVFDPSCVHQVPAAVDHEAQQLFDSLCDDPEAVRDLEQSRRQLLADNRQLEDLRLRQWHSLSTQLAESREQARLAMTQADEAGQQLREAKAQLVDSRQQLTDVQRELITSQQGRHEMQDRIIQGQERELELWRERAHLQSRVERFESHPLLGPAIRARRGVRNIIHAVAARSPHEKSTLHVGANR